MYQKDDVLSSGFVAEYAIVKQVKTQANSHTAGINNSVILSDDFVCQYLEGQWELQANITCSSLDSLFAGPYLVVGNCIHEAWQLLPDTFDSFVCGIIPQESDGRTFRTLYSNVDIYKAVAVPSRWHYTPSAEKPLNGMRVTIKDNFSIENIRTTQTNRAWAEVNGPEAESAEFVNLLTAKGAKVIGKTKMCSFASSEEATDGWIDFHAPFNPRADGYQSSSGSTTGGATSLAGHDWVDVSIGTDTTGSIRWPAAWHGLFGLRMTHGAVDMTGVYKSCIEFDALGLLGRSLQTLERVAAVSLELDMTQYTRRRPKRILVSEDFLPWGDRAQQAMVEQFVRVLEKFLGFEREPMSIAKLWEASPPEGVHGKSLREYIENTAADLFYYDGYHEFDGFRAEYRRKFKKPPYVGPYMRWKW
jgi:Asp-tRNA(Asn)/Glu-tRNA(Gln) amidotransferase A subunit family amidase